MTAQSAADTLAIDTLIDYSFLQGSFVSFAAGDSAPLIPIGYDRHAAAAITGAVSSATETMFNRGHLHHPAQLIQGRLAGLTAARPGGNPNEDFTLRVRSLATILGDGGPLLVVDGLPQRSLEGVDPLDIERIDVLKDASAAAIYGIRGGGGVLQITTKGGGSGPPQVSYHGYLSRERAARTVPVLDPDAYRLVPAANDFGSDTDWQDAVTRTAFSQAHHLALRGGISNTRYRASVSYRDAQGILRESSFRRFAGRLHLRQQAFNDRLTLTLHLSAAGQPFRPGFGEAFYYAAVYNPTAPVRFSPDGPLPPSVTPEDVERFGGYWQQVRFDYYNPVALIEQNRAEGRIDTWSGQLRGALQLAEGLQIDAFYARRRENRQFGRYFSKFSFWRGVERNGLAEQRHDAFSNQLFESTLRFERRYGALGLRLLGGYAYQYFVDEGFGAEGGNFLTDAFSFHNLAAALDFADGQGTVFSYKESHKLAAFFGRAQLDWNDTWFLTLSLRREGSSRLGINNQWGTFPAVQGGVRLGPEGSNPAYRLFARAGYGLTGNLPPENYLSRLRFRPWNRYPVNGQWEPVYEAVSNPNPDLRWETNRSVNVGVDASFFHGRLTGSIDYYRHRTEDLLLQYFVPVPPNLYSNSYANVGSMNTRGVEFQLGYQTPSARTWQWQGRLNLSAYHTALGELSDETYDFGGYRLIASYGSCCYAPILRVEENGPVGQFYGLRYSGISTEGNWIFEDINRDGQIDNRDWTEIGNGLPAMELGFDQTIRFGHFDFHLFFRGIFGHDLVNINRVFYETPQAAETYNLLESYIPELTDFGRLSSYQVERASFLRLDNLTLGYSLPLPPQAAFSRLRFYLTGQNLFTLTSYQGADPELRLDPGTGQLPQLGIGIDRRGGWLPVRGWTVGVEAGF